MYTIGKVEARPRSDEGWDDAAWSRADPLRLDHFRPEGSGHRPKVDVKLLFDEGRIYVFFRVEDQYVRAIRTEYQSPVCKDSCVEFFVRPRGDTGYFNFECNCGGTLLASFLEDWRRTPDGFVKRTLLDETDAEDIEVHSSLPQKIEEEITDPITWWLKLTVGRPVFERYLGPLGDFAGTEWRANFYKCGDELSHPHWGSWQPVGGALNFHQPEYFGRIRFEADRRGG